MGFVSSLDFVSGDAPASTHGGYFDVDNTMRLSLSLCPEDCVHSLSFSQMDALSEGVICLWGTYWKSWRDCQAHVSLFVMFIPDLVPAAHDRGRWI